MLQFAVALYCLAVVSGLTFGITSVDSPFALFTLLVLSAAALLVLAPGALRFLIGLICATPPAPANAPRSKQPEARPSLGAPGTPGAASPRAPSAAFTLA